MNRIGARYLPLILLALLAIAVANGSGTRAAFARETIPTDGSSIKADKGEIPTSPSLIRFKDLKVSPTMPETVTLANGIIVYLLEDHDLPLVVADAKLKVGSIYEPADKVGLAGICGEVMRTGGTKSWSGNALDDELEFLAAVLGSSIGAEQGSASLDVRSQDLETGIKMLSEMLRYPRFEEEKIAIAKQNRLEGILRRNDSAGGIAGREFMRLVYGKDSPWARIIQPATIKAITRDDIVAFHAKYYFPNNMRLGLSGDFDKAKVLELLNRYFGDWAKGEVTFPDVPKVNPAVPKGVYLVKKDVPQSVVIMGHLGYRRLDPAQLPLTLFNELFGAGGFSSRLMREVRSNRGLAYSVGGGISKGTDLGVFMMQAETKAGSTVEAAELMESELQNVVKGPITKGELELARDSVINSFVFTFESPSEIISLKMDLDFYGYPGDWLTTYVDRLRKVTVEEVQAAAQKFMKPESMVVLVVGDPAKFDKPLIDMKMGEPIEVKLDPVE